MAYLLAVAIAAAGGMQAAQALDWLAGDWCEMPRADSDLTCEHWSPMAGGTMLGTSQTVRADRTTGYEFMRIAVEDGVPVFHGSPGGAPAVAFRRIASDGASVTFGNDSHDYPQRIRYWRVGDALHAEVALADGRQSIRWTYYRVGD